MNTVKPSVLWLVAAACVIGTTGCSGGSGTSIDPNPSATQQATAVGPLMTFYEAVGKDSAGRSSSSSLRSVKGTTPFTFTFNVPAVSQTRHARTGARRAANARRASYISQATESFFLVVTSSTGEQAAGVGSCVQNADNTGSCSISFAIPFGSDTAEVTLFSGPYASGVQLCYGVAYATVYQNATNTISIKCDPILGEVDFTLNDPVTGAGSSISLAAASPSSFSGTLVPYDQYGFVANYGAIDRYRLPNLTPITIGTSVSGNSSISVSPDSFSNAASGFTLSGSYAGGNGSTATVTPLINGSAVVSCSSASSADPICTNAATVTFH